MPVPRPAVALLALACCAPSVTGDLETSRVLDHRIPIALPRAVDLLLVVDDSASMQEERELLPSRVAALADVLESLEGGLPDLHIGVVSTDVGATLEVPGCRDRIEDGGLLETSTALGGARYIVDRDGGPAGRVKNYTGSLADAIAELADLGTSGCGFEAPLEAMRRALDGRHPENLGFLRESSILVVLFITDEDDCSVRDRAGFFDGVELGVDDAAASFACFEHGVACDPDAPREPGEKSGCVPREPSPYLTDVSEYVDFLDQLAPLVVVGGALGQPEPADSGAGYRAAVLRDADSREVLAPACDEPGFAQAAPAIRLTSFIRSFRDSSLVSLCSDDISGTLIPLAQFFTTVGGPPTCLAAETADPPECAAWLEDEEGKPLRSVPECGPRLPCYRLIPPDEIRDSCDGRPAIEYQGDGREPPFTVFHIQCVAEAP